MASAETTKAAPAKKAVRVTLTGTDLIKKRALRRRLRKAGREKLTTKLVGDKAFAKTYFDGRSKRSTDKKAAFRKKKSKKK